MAPNPPVLETIVSTLPTPRFSAQQRLCTPRREEKQEAQRRSHQQLQSDLAEEHQRLNLSCWQPQTVLMEIKSPEELASVGVVGCLKEAGKLICHHARLLLLITLATYLPFFIARNWDLIPEEHRQDYFNGHRLVRPTPQILTPEDLRNMRATPYLLFGAICGLLSSSVYFLHLAAVTLTVASVYGQGESKIGIVSIMRPLPAVFKRMVVTFLWTLFVSKVFTVLLTGLVSIKGFIPFIERLESMDPKIDSAISLLRWFLPHLIIDLFLIFDQYATVMEADMYGYAALVRSITLTKRKKLAVIALETIFMILLMTPRWVRHMFGAGATKEALIPHLLFLLYMHMFPTVRFVVVAVFYVACKAFHADTSAGHSGFYPISKYMALPSNIT